MKKTNNQRPRRLYLPDAAGIFGLSRSQLARLCAAGTLPALRDGVQWYFNASDEAIRAALAKLPTRKRLTAADIEQAAQWRAEGMVYAEIAGRLGVTEAAVWRRLTQRARADAMKTQKR